MAQKVLTSRKVKESIKRGKSDIDLMNEYSFDEEAFDEQMDLLFYPEEKTKTMRQLRKNRKKKNNAEVVKEEVLQPDPSELTLEQEEEGLSEEVIVLEQQYQANLLERSAYKADVEDCIKKLKEHLEAIEKIGERMKENQDGYNASVEKGNEILDEIRPKKARLEEIRASRIVTIYVYSDGTLESESELDESGWEGVKNELSDNDACLYLTNLQTRTLAKVISIKNNCEKECEFVFDEQEIEAIYQSLV